MRKQKERHYSLAVGLIALGCFLLLGYAVKAHDILPIDRQIIAEVQGWETPLLTAVMKIFTFIGSVSFVIILALLVLLFLFWKKGHHTELLLFSAVMAVEPLLNRIIKACYQRNRPDFYRLIEEGGWSFPSGHAMNACTFYGITAFLLWRHIPGRNGRVLLILGSISMIIIIGLSRIYLGVHYPSDIAGGFLAAIILLAAAVSVFQRYFRPPADRDIGEEKKP